jgi:hypothetical protein
MKPQTYLIEPIAYRVTEFCRRYAISKSSFYREVRADRLRLFKRGRTTLVLRNEAERWFTGLSQRPPEGTGSNLPPGTFC